MSTTAPLAVGTASAQASLAKDLGKIYWLSGRAYRLVRSTAAITAAAGSILVGTVAAGAFTWAVVTSTTAGDPTVVGIVPAGQTGSTGTTGLIAGDYFLITVSGCVDCITAAAVTNNALIGCSGTAKKTDDASVTAGVGAAGIALETGGGADEAMGVYLKGLI